MNKIWFFGDSNTDGYNTSYQWANEYINWKGYKPKFWTELLANKLELPFENCGKGGSDNYTILDYKKRVDYKNCMVNNMWEINNSLGIEAVRKFLINEINEIITSGGINVDKVHFELLADSMTCTGSITSVSRYGIGRNETGPLTKASFEQSLDNMLIAAYRAEVESIKSVSSSVILGQCSKIGSGMMDLYNKIV